MSNFTLSAFSDEIDDNLEVAMDVLQSFDIHHIEIRGVDGRNISTLTLEETEHVWQRLDAKGFRISAIGSPLGKIGIEDPFEPHLALLDHVLTQAKILHTNFIRVFSFYVPEGTAASHRSEVLRRMELMVEAAANVGITLLHENEKDIYGDVASRCADLFESIPSPYFKATFDPANFIQCGRRIPEAWALLQKHVRYIHIKDACFEDGQVMPAGEGDGQVPWLIHQLRLANFEGLLSLEPHLGQFHGLAAFENHTNTVTSEPAGIRTFKIAATALLKILENPQKDVLFGVIGIGNMGSSHAKNLLAGNVHNASLGAVADHNPARREWANEELPGIPFFDSAEELMSSGLVDVVLIATPHYDHVPLAIMGFQKGLHVLVEKPAGVTTKDVSQMNLVAADHDLIFGIMYNQRTNPLYQKMREMVQTGELGAIFRTNWIITDWYRTQSYYNSGGWRATWAGEGGGVLLNQDPHQLDLWQWICGMPTKVRAFMGFGQWHNIEVEDSVTAYVEYPNGATGVFVTTTAEAPGTNRFEIVGEKGKLVSEYGRLDFYKNSESMFTHCATSPESFQQPACTKIEIPINQDSPQHVGIMQNMTDAILFGTPLLAPGAEGIHGLTISNAMHLSAWTDTTITLPMDGDAFEEKLKQQIHSL